MASESFTQLLTSLTEAGNLPTIKSHFPNLPPASPLLKAIALQAVKSHQPEILTWAVSQGFHLPPQSLNNDFYHALCDSQSVALFKALVDGGFDLNTHTSEYYGQGTALVVACNHGNVELARFLLENGQDPNSDWSGEAIIFAASGERRKLEMVELLLKFGIKLAGTGAAIAAAEKDDLPIMKLCLENGCGLEESDCLMWVRPADSEDDLEGTALYRACRAGAVKAVEYLLEKGADTAFRDEKGRDCLGVASDWGRTEVVRLLVGRGVVKEPVVTARNARMVDEANWTWRGELPDVFCVD